MDSRRDLLKRSFEDRIRNERLAAAQLYISPETKSWLDQQYIHIMSNSGARLGRATVARAIVDAFASQGVSFAECRSEAEINEKVRAMIRPATEVKG